MSIFDTIRSTFNTVGNFFKSDTFDTVKTIAGGVRDVTKTIADAAGRVDLSQPPTGLVDPNVSLSQFKIRGTSRSKAGVSSFGDVQEETYYKYAQAQNLVRYLYSAKSRYKNMTKSRT